MMQNTILNRQLTKYNYNTTNYVGEITGDNVDSINQYDKGMPMRSTYSMKDSTQINDHVDFNLFDKIEDTTTINSVNEYTELNMATEMITKNTDPYETCIHDINSVSFWMYTTINKLTQNACIINGISIFTLFGILYLTSKNTLENELKNYFGFQEKKYLNAGLLTISDELTNIRSQLIFDNYLLHDTNIKANTNKINNINKIINNIIINKNNPQEEIIRINNIFKKNSNLDNIMSINTLLHIKISLVSISKIYPIWKYKIDKITSKHIHFINKTFSYYDNSQHQIIEIPLYNSHYVIGYINNLQKESIDLKLLTIAINYMKPTIISDVVLPIIKTRYKTRLNTILTKTGIKCFTTNSNDNILYPNFMLSDYLQYVDFNISTKSANINCNNKGCVTTKKFICNNIFELYIRNTNTNAIIMLCKIII
jgi:hypothetical protein